MITFFTTAKPFRGHAGVIQRNAITSWTRIRPTCEVLLFGDEDGSAELGAELGITHVPHVQRNEFGMPRVESLFAEARRRATTPLLCYANADILFTSELVTAAQRSMSFRDRFLMVGQRVDVDIREALAFGADWEDALRVQVACGEYPLGWGIDYFVFPATLWAEIPRSLAVGRAGWDNWPLYAARLHGAVLIDATPVVLAVHQRHDYSHHPGGARAVYAGPEAQRNYNTLGGIGNVFTVLDATHILTHEELRLRCRSCHPVCVCKPACFSDLPCTGDGVSPY